MITPEELLSLECLVQRARAAAAGNHLIAAESINPGDVVQIRPGCDPAWDSSLMLVMWTDNRRVRGQILRPHRSGCREAWASYKPGEVLRVGRVVYPEPAAEVKSWCYEPPCDLHLRKPPTREGAPPTPAEVRAAGENYRASYTERRADRNLEIPKVAEIRRRPKGPKK